MRAIITITLLALCIGAKGQNLDREAFSSGGGTTTVGTLSLSHTFGQTFGMRQTQGGTVVTQGFQQNYAPIGCGAPTGLTVSQITDVRVYVSLSPVPGAFRYRVRYRPVGETTWKTTYINAPANGKFINLLVPNTLYQWEVRTQCVSSSGPNSSTSIGPQFSTLTTCPSAQNVGVTEITQTTARITWDQFLGASSIKVRYRVLGATTWKTSTASVSSTSKKVTILLPATTYEYTVAVTCSNGTTSLSPVQTFTTLGAPGGRLAMTEDGSFSYRLFPNPNQGRFNIEAVTPYDGQVQLRLFDLTGRELISRIWDVSTQESLHLDLNLPKGAYLISLEHSGGKAVERVIVD